MSLPARRRRGRQRWGRLARLRRDQVLTLLEDYPFPEVVYVELWMVPTLFGRSAHRLTAYERCFGVLILMNTVSRCRVMLFIIGEPLRRCAVASLIMSAAVQLWIRGNRELGPDGCKVLRGPRGALFKPGLLVADPRKE